MKKLGDLDQRIQQKIAESQKETELLKQQQLESLKKELAQTSQNALNSFRKDIHKYEQIVHRRLQETCEEVTQQTQYARKTLSQFWLAQICLTSILGLGFYAGTWGWIQYVSNQTKAMHRQQQSLSQEIENLQKSARLLQEKTWGVGLMETDNGKFVVLPETMRDEAQWTCGGQPCMKLEE